MASKNSLKDSSWFRQFGALVCARVRVARRSVVSTAAQLFIGAAVCLLLLVFQQIANAVLSVSTLHPPTTPVGAIPACVASPISVRANADGSTTAGCNTLLYAPTTPLTTEIMQRVAANAGLDPEIHAVAVPGTSTAPFDLSLTNVSLTTADTCVPGGCVLPSAQCLPCDWVRDNLTMTSYFIAHPNGSQNAVWFFGAYVDDLSHALMYNLSTTQYPFFADAHTLALKRSIDEVLIELGYASNFSLSLSSRSFPRPPPRLVGYDVFSANGGQWLFIVPMITFFLLLVDLVYEKESKLRLAMTQMGLRVSAYWSAWLTYAVCVNLLSTSVLEVFGYVIGFTFFRNSTPAVSFLCFGLFAVVMTCAALLISTLLKTARGAQTAAYSVIVVGFVFQFIISSAYAGMIDLLYSQDIYDWVVALRYLLHLVYPPFNFALLFYSISTLSGSTIDTAAGKLVQGPGFHWADLYQGRTRVFAGFTCNLPAPVVTIYYLLGQACWFVLLAVYLDAVLDRGHGVPKHPLFFLGWEYATVSSDLVADDDDGDDPGVIAEHAATSTSAASGADSVVRVHRLRVVYRRAAYCSGAWAALYEMLSRVSAGCCRRDAAGPVYHELPPFHAESLSINAPPVSGGNPPPESVTNAGRDRGSGDVVAVSNLSLSLRPNEILTLLGHNGAGKSTLLAVLTGLTPPTAGHAEVFGQDVRTQKGKLHEGVGICPQHDILWARLTAHETLQLFCTIKGISAQECAAAISDVLTQVRLQAVAHKLVGTFSGGMKRRLSVALAALGKPRVIFLDEPTTGMDPVNRLKVWSLIQSLRESAAVVLTTHNMEEANILSDRVAIMAHGRLAALGPALRFKTLYGQGYRLNAVLAAPEQLPQMLAGVQQRVAGASLALHDAASVSFTIPFASVGRLPETLEWLESLSADRVGANSALVREYGVSGPSLESVFLRVSAAAKFDLAQQTTGMDHADGTEAAHIVSDAAPEQLHEPAVSLTSQTWALTVKQATLTTRQRGLFFCQLLTPLVVLLLLAVLQRIIKAEVGETRTQLIPSLLLPVNMNTWYSVSRSYSPSSSNNDDDPVPPLDAPSDAASLVREWLTASQESLPHFDAYVWPESASWIDTVLATVQDVAPACNHKAPAAAVARIARALLGAADVCESDDVDLASSAASYDTDCLEFFLWTASPDRDGDTSLATRIGGQPRVFAPSVGHGVQPPPPSNVSVNASGLLSHVPSSWCELRNGSLVNSAFWDARLGNPGDVDQELMDIASMLNNVSTSALDVQPPCWPISRNSSYDPDMERWACPAYLLPDAAVDFQDVDFSVASARLAYTLQVNDLSITGYHRPSNFSRLGLLQIPKWAQSLALTVDPARVALVDLLTRAYVANVTASHEPALPGNISLPTVVAVATYPFLQVQNILQFVEIVGAVLHPITLSLQLPLFVYVLALEKEERLVELQRAMGLRFWPRVLVTYGLNLLSYVIVASVFWIAARVMQFTFFTQTSAAVLAAGFFGWGLALCSLAMFMSVFLSSRQAAAVAGYLVALFTNLFAILIAAGIYGFSLPFSLGQPMPKGFYIFPTFGLARFLYLGTFRCIAMHSCYTSFADAMAPGSEIRSAVASLYLDALVYFVVALYLDEVLPRRYGVAKHPLFCLPARWLRPNIATATAEASFRYLDAWRSYVGLDSAAAATEYATGEDDDVQQERQRTAQLRPDGEPSAACPVIIHHIRKEFDGSSMRTRCGMHHDATDGKDASRALLADAESIEQGASSGIHLELEQQALPDRKVAVSDFCLAIEAGSCFGLLGENGAGKSTLINVLQGLFPPSAGDAWINGHHVVHDLDRARLSMGICPQHDTLWSDLTIAEHLRYFARIKGVPAVSLETHIESTMRSVGLHSFANRRAGALSGGMRRRLSIALALVGGSRIVLADEPTTGLDAASRRAIWRILERARAGRVVLLVSHDMSEVEALATRLCVMTHSRMRCLGTPLGLKTRYGGGYLLSVSYQDRPANAAASSTKAPVRDRVRAHLLACLPGSRVEQEFTGYLALRVPADVIVQSDPPSRGISGVFAFMSAPHTHECGITDWSVSQVSLDHVFAYIVGRYRGATRTVDDEEHS